MTTNALIKPPIFRKILTNATKWQLTPQNANECHECQILQQNDTYDHRMPTYFTRLTTNTARITTNAAMKPPFSTKIPTNAIKWPTTNNTEHHHMSQER